MSTRSYAILATIMALATAKSQSSNSSSSDTLVDVFPLRPGSTQTYVFSDSGAGGDEMTGSSFGDTGRVQYRIIDSTSANDSTIAWNILEIHDYQHRGGTYGAYSFVDTNYHLSDTSHLALYEKRLGRHELACSGVIWSFPLIHYPEHSSVSVFRYAALTDSTMVSKWQNTRAYGGGTDSLYFSMTAGLYRRNLSAAWTSGYLWGRDNLTVQEEFYPLAVFEQQAPKLKYFQLDQNFPNPFNPITAIVFHLAKESYVSLKMFSMLGQEIETLAEGSMRSGQHTVQWNASSRPSGVYFYRLRTKDFSETKRLLLLK